MSTLLTDPSDALVDRMAEAAALHQDHDGCFERVREWEALGGWERDAHPDERPQDDYEAKEIWRGRIRAALAAADPGQPAGLTPTERVVAEVRHERAAQHARWGVQDLPDGTGPDRQLLHTGMTYGELAKAAKARTDAAAEVGRVTYADILLEEVLEALAEADPGRLRGELIQLSAVGVQWVEAGDRRNPTSVEGTQK